jgi:hypothetical protein
LGTPEQVPGVRFPQLKPTRIATRPRRSPERPLEE